MCDQQTYNFRLKKVHIVNRHSMRYNLTYTTIVGSVFALNICAVVMLLDNYAVRTCNGLAV